MGRGLGTLQLEIMAEVMRMVGEITPPPKPLPVVELAKRLRCSPRQVRRAVYAMAERGLVVVTKGPRAGRQGQTLFVWEARFYESWQDFTDPVRIEARWPERYGEAIERDLMLQSRLQAALQAAHQMALCQHR